MGNMKASSHRLHSRGSSQLPVRIPNPSKSHCRCETLLKIPLPFHDLFLRSLKTSKKLSVSRHSSDFVPKGTTYVLSLRDSWCSFLSLSASSAAFCRAIALSSS